ncbi:MAG TPA: UDP-glucose 4-epimerase GalE [Fimbriimonadaceae bacterium]|nr:UDP-glucose 4-epimerase GalE [Fimbriimonadaceae bacterium]
MKLFVTGAAGYIGSVVTEQLIREGHTVAAFDSLKSGNRASIPADVELIVGDMRDREAVKGALEASRAEAVMHFAAESIVSESYEDPGRHFEVNVGGGVNLLQAMAECGVFRLVFSSTAAVYGESESNPITEDTPTVPVNPYGESKLQFERMLPWFAERYGLQHVSLRYFNAAGATEANGESRPKETHLIPILLEVAAGRRDSFTLFGDDYPTPDGTCIRDYVHVADIAAAHVLALEQIERLPSRIYNLGTGRGASNREVLSAVERVTGVPIAPKVEGRRPGDPAVLVASADRIARELGWRPQGTLESMIEDAWRWNLKHPKGYEGTVTRV